MAPRYCRDRRLRRPFGDSAIPFRQSRQRHRQLVPRRPRPGLGPRDDGWLKWFSNEPGSLATARGAYISWEWYTGKYGTSVRLGSLDPDNSNTFDRAIVMHAAEYCTQAHVDRWGRLGRSNGCFALSPEDFLDALANLSGGRLLYADRLGLV